MLACYCQLLTLSFVLFTGYLFSDQDQVTTRPEVASIPQQLSTTSLSTELEEEMATSDYFSMSPSHSRQPSISVVLNEVPPEEMTLPSLLPMHGASETQALHLAKGTSWAESVGVTWQR